jgi:hypothetical protein
MDVAVHRTIVCVDVEGFGDRRRTNRDQVAVRAGLYRALRTAFARSKIDWDSCYHEDRGDGVLVLVPAEVPKELLVAPVLGKLAGALARYNQVAGHQRRIRLRAAVHAGEVHYDEHGVAGMAINTTFRLLAADALKEILCGSPGALALIASQWFYDEVIRHSPKCKPTTYRPVRVAVKETKTSPGSGPSHAGHRGGGATLWPPGWPMAPIIAIGHGIQLLMAGARPGSVVDLGGGEGGDIGAADGEAEFVGAGEPDAKPPAWPCSRGR